MKRKLFVGGVALFLVCGCNGPQTDGNSGDRIGATASPAVSQTVQSEPDSGVEDSLTDLPDKPVPPESSNLQIVLACTHAFSDSIDEKARGMIAARFIDEYRFQELEELAASYRKFDGFQDGYPIHPLTGYYYALKSHGRGQGADVRLTRLLDWATRRPEAIEPRIAALRLLCEVAQSPQKRPDPGPRAPRVARMLANPLAQAGDVFESLVSLKSKASKDPEFYGAALEYLTVSRGDPQKAKELYEEGVASFPDHISIHGRYATYLAAMGQPFQHFEADPLVQIMVERTYLGKFEVDWKTNKARFQKALKGRAFSSYLLSLCACEADKAGDIATSKQMLELLGLREELFVWKLPALLSARRKAGLPSKPSELKVLPVRKFNQKTLDSAPKIALFDQTIAYLSYLEQFELLDEVSEQLRQDGSRFENGFPKLLLFHSSYSDPWHYEDSLPDFIARTERWLEARPESVSAKTLMATLLTNRGWQARGGGLASSVTEEGWKGFYADLNQAKKLLEPLVSGPGPYDLAMLGAWAQLGVGLGFERSVMDDAVAKAEKIDPFSARVHQVMGDYLLERWHGAPGEREKFLAAMPDTVYADFVWRNESRRLNGLDELVPLDWRKVNRGLHQRAKKFNDLGNWSEALLSAVHLRDRKLAAEAIKGLAGRTPNKLNSLDDWEPIKDWALNGKPWSLPASYYVVPAVTPGANLFR